MFSHITEKLQKLRKLLKNKLSYGNKLSFSSGFAWILLAQSSRVFTQSGYFVLIARSLGAEQYGAFAGIVALVTIPAYFVNLGSGDILVRNVSRDRSSFSTCWGNALALTFSLGILFSLIIIPLADLFLPDSIPIKAIIFIAFSDLIFTRLLEVSSQAFQSISKLNITAQLNFLYGFAKLFAAFLFNVTPSIDKDLASWSIFYFLSSLLVSLLSVVYVNTFIGYPSFSLINLKEEAFTGLGFSISLASRRIYNDIDKVMLVRLSSLQATGLYAAAYRIIDVAFVPIRSILMTTYSSFFKHGSRGLIGSLNFAFKLMPISITYGLLVSISIFMLAPLVPKIVGSDFAEAATVLRWLAPIPFIRVIHYFAADALTGANLQSVRSAAQVSIALINIVLNFLFIPLYSWKGAAVASIISDMMLACSLWLYIIILVRKQDRHV
jgi:O-antigen/teichoic acid export membrane protein